MRLTKCNQHFVGFERNIYFKTFCSRLAVSQERLEVERNMASTSRPARSSKGGTSKPLPLHCTLYVTPFRCQNEECSELFYFHSDFINHTAISHDQRRPYRCTECAAGFSTKWNLTEHIEQIHPQAERERIQCPFKCNYCGESFSRDATLRKHEKRRHSKELDRVSKEALDQKANGHHTMMKDKRFQCTLCSKSYGVRGSLNAHIRRVHEGEIRFKCRDCGAPFYNR